VLAQLLGIRVVRVEMDREFGYHLLRQQSISSGERAVSLGEDWRWMEEGKTLRSLFVASLISALCSVAESTPNGEKASMEGQARRRAHASHSVRPA
jgi:hypothetical protein